MRIVAVTCTELFIGEPTDPLQVILVEVESEAVPLRIQVSGAGVSGEITLHTGQTGQPGRQPVEVGVRCAGRPGAAIPIRVTAEAATGPGPTRATAQAELIVAEPGWTVWMVPHFHYDPIWWNTQAAYTATWGQPGQSAGEFRMDWQHTGFDLVRLHLETARRDADYKFVLAELDYLKPYWDAHPQDRPYLRTLISQGRVELMGGTYNEPNTNLTSAESTIRNLVYGVGFQRDVLGGDPRTAWQLDAFGHDPQFPGLVADAGLDSSSWARGPFHQWGPMLWTHEPRDDGWGAPSAMQFFSEFEWLSPSGKGVLTHYMPAHYSAGWQIDSMPTLAMAEQSVYNLFLLLKSVAATRNVLLPVGTDYTPPAKWVTEIHRDWNARYLWPRFVCGLPREFFAAVREQLDRTGTRPSPQTRDMNPIYTGKDVSFIDTKQAQRHAEALLTDAEMFATIAAAHGAAYPHAAIDKAWRQLVYGAHHDAITGTESDQVYLDLLTGWREAYDLAGGVLARSLEHLSAQLSGAGATPDDTADDAADRRVVVFNPSSWSRTDVVRVRVEFPAPGSRGVTVRSDTQELPLVLEHPRHHADGSLAAVDVVFLAMDVPAVGYRTWLLAGTAQPSPVGWRPVGWRPVGDGSEPAIENDAYRLTVDPARGGCVSQLRDKRSGRELLQPGRVGNELLVYEEYPAHPRFSEGPWHLLPKGAPVLASAQLPATSVLVERSPLGERVTVAGAVGPLRYTQQLTLWHGIDRLDATTHVDDFTGADQLVRLRWPAAVPGALPVSEVGNAVVGRGFGLVDVDSERAPWTLDNPAQHWFALSTTARIDLYDLDGTRQHTRAIGVAEIISPDRVRPDGVSADGVTADGVTADGVTADGVSADETAADAWRDLAVALVRQGVTATCSAGTGARYGNLAVDSNLPDVRIAVGGPDTNAFTMQVLGEAEPGYAAELARQLAATGRARVWVPATRPLAEVWVPDADLTGTRALPVLIVAGADEVHSLCAQLDSGAVGVHQPAALSNSPDPDLDDHTVGLVNRGIPGFAVDTTGALHLSLLRSCTGWPSGIWIDPPRRTGPDGSNFQQQHWTHSFDYALVAGAGDWRSAQLVAHGHELNHPLTATVITGGPTRARSFVTVEPMPEVPARSTGNAGHPASSAGRVVLAALKPAGNPLANGRLPGSRVERVTARLYEAAGRETRARLRLWAPVTEAVEADLLERPASGRPAGGVPRAAADTVELPLTGASISQLLIGLSPEAVGDPEEVHEFGAAEPFQPVYSRYWLHNTGPAPIGNLPIAVHLDPPHAPVAGPVTLTVTVASDLTEELAAGVVELVVPDGWRCTPATVHYDLKPGGHVEHRVVVTAPERPPAGVYWVRARTGSGGQTIEDVARLLVGVQGPETLQASMRYSIDGLDPQDLTGELRLRKDRSGGRPQDLTGELRLRKDRSGGRPQTDPLRLRPGQAATIDLTLDSDAATAISVQVQLVSPWHTWELFPDANTGVEVPARGRARMRLPVRVPDNHRAGRWWALVKLAHAGQLHYTQPIEVEVLP
jgi:alpha-mannosidase